jgi:hypothetical protein
MWIYVENGESQQNQMNQSMWKPKPKRKQKQQKVRALEAISILPDVVAER